MKKHREIEVLARGVCVRAGKLLVCRGKADLNIYLPGGHVDFGEGAEKALCREIKEELGGKARIKQFLGCAEHAFTQNGEKHVEVNLVFEVTIGGITVATDPKSCEEHIEFQWVPMRDLKGSSLEPRRLRKQLPIWLKSRGSIHWSSNLFSKNREKG